MIREYLYTLFFFSLNIGEVRARAYYTRVRALVIYEVINGNGREEHSPAPYIAVYVGNFVGNYIFCDVVVFESSFLAL